MNEALEAKIKETVKAFERRGLAVLDDKRTDGGILLHLPSKTRRTYLGTYLNIFSVNTNGKVDPCLLWEDQVAIESAEVLVSPVYRHNGTSENVSLGIWFIPGHVKISPFPTKFSYERQNKPKYIELVKKLSPFDYMAHPETLVSTGGGVLWNRVAKLSQSVGVRAINNAVEKTMVFVDAFVPEDHSAFARDPKDYHPDTTKEFGKWVLAGRPDIWPSIS